MTWKQLRYLVEAALDSHGIDVARQPVHIRFCNVREDHTSVNVEVHTGSMPKSCGIQIFGNRKT